MELSVVIVNYNVKHFLKQCLSSVFASTLDDTLYDVWVVDNDSVDGSMDMVREQFPQVHCIINETNVGFGKANNQAIAASSGKNVLLLNPDTIIAEDTLSVCLDYLQKHVNVGAIGVRMIDGSGQFLPESKRGLPTVWNSFCKLTGLNYLFPKVKLFSGYTLSHLDEHQTASVDVLCGAYLMIPRSVINSVGMFDERFFMYAEDIDLSYRIKKAGYDIVYLADTEIIHYKGESSKKGSLSYVKMFYESMIVYVKKHYDGAYGKIFVLALKAAIVARGALTYLQYGLSRWLLPLIHLLSVAAIGYGAKYIWAIIRYKNAAYYDNSPIWSNIWMAAVVMIMSTWMVQGYRKSAGSRRLVSGLLLGTVLSLALYGLLDSTQRSSRAVLLLTGVGAIVVLPLLTYALKRLLGSSSVKRILVIGDQSNASKIVEVMALQSHTQVVGTIHPDHNEVKEGYLNTYDSLKEVARVMKINEVIFSRPDLDMSRVIDTMRQLGSQISYKISGDDLLAMVGSGSKNHQGEIYTVDISFRLGQSEVLATKYSFDKVLAVLSIILSPLSWPLNRLSGCYWRDVWEVIRGLKTWVGYAAVDRQTQLPQLRQHVIDIRSTDQSALEYAKSYRITYDFMAFSQLMIGRVKSKTA